MEMKTFIKLTSGGKPIYVATDHIALIQDRTIRTTSGYCMSIDQTAAQLVEQLAGTTTEPKASTTERPTTEYQGAIKGFPKEVVDRLLIEQEHQGIEPDVTVFEESRYAGIDWEATADGRDFWERVMKFRDFELFYSRYPRE